MNEMPKKKSSLIVRLLKGLFLLIVLAVVAIVLIGMFVLDGKFDVSRSITIKAAPAAIHAQVGDLREWPNWLPFPKHDKTIKTTIEQPTGVGAKQNWTGDTGKGKLTFTSTDEAKGIEFDMVMGEVWPSKGSLLYSKAGDDTLVTWRMHGQYSDFMGKWIALVMSPMVSPMFDEGLGDLKKKVETK